MGNYWADRLAREAGPAQPPAAIPAAQTWWANDLYTRDYGRTPSPATQQAPPGPQSPARPLPTARHQQAVGRCPSCAGDNYFKVTAATVATCWDCGYPVQHSTSGMTNPNTAGEAVKAALGQSRGQGYRPDIIIGRI